MKFLVDTSPAKMKGLIERPLVLGQLLTPLTSYANAGGVFAIDNGAFSGFNYRGFIGLLERNYQHRERCLFVVCPDVVGNCRRTFELWQNRDHFVGDWPAAFVAQDGCEDMEIPWKEMSAIFIGGNDPWKDSAAVQDIVRTAKILEMHVHVGRVNEYRRYRLFADLGADTCDGSGIAMYDHMLRNLERKLAGEGDRHLFTEIEGSGGADEGCRTAAANAD